LHIWFLMQEELTMSQTATAEAPAPAPAPAPRLMMPKADAMRHLAGQLEDAMQVRNMRIKSTAALDSARELKMRWAQRTGELLVTIFGSEAFAEQALSWVGRILPEYAELDMFVEQFVEEMDHHIAQMKTILKSVQKIPDPAARALAAQKAEAAAQAPSQPVARPANPGQAAQAHPAPKAAAKHAVQSKQLQQEKQNMINGMMLVVGECGDAANQVNGFIKPLGLSLVSANGSSDGQQPVAAALSQHQDLAFALVLDSSEAPQEAQAPCEGLSFELGFCVGRLGLGRVFVLQPKASQPFTDKHGIVHLPIDPAGGWQLHLARHLKRGGIEIDLNKLC
jgi:hypothetical protein